MEAKTKKKFNKDAEAKLVRLTKTYEDGSHGVAENLPCGENSYAFKNLLIDTLGKYEDLGYTQEELKEIIEANQITRAYERENELNEYKKTGIEAEEIYELLDDLQALNTIISETETELNEYKRTAEQGLLIQLPCKPEDMVYELEVKKCKEYSK